MAEPNSNEIAGAAVAALIESASKHLAEAAGGVAGRVATNLRANMKSYLEQTYLRVSSYRTLINPAIPVSIANKFVPLSIRFGSSVISHLGLSERLAPGARIIVTAPAGRGKSIVLKYLALCRFENPLGQIPLFVELREVNNVATVDIIQFIYDNYIGKRSYTFDRFEEQVSAGSLALILDGFDEIDPDFRKTIEASILDVSRRFPNSIIVVSSRFDRSLYSWDRFIIAELLPMRKTQTIKLIRMLDYDEVIKRKFIALVRKGLYEKQTSFLSNPLLATLMLLIYEQFGQVPEKAYLLYEHAFETLLRRHDVMKAQFSRNLFSKLSKDELKDVFTVFCALSYADSVHSFTVTLLYEYIKRALSYCKLQAKPEALARDLTESICMLQPEGLSIVFVHRSFQEYFTATFLVRLDEHTRCKLMDNFCARSYDNVLPMAYAISGETFETEWVLPNIDRYLRCVGEDLSGINLLTVSLMAGFRYVFYQEKYHLIEFIDGKFVSLFNVIARIFDSNSSDTRLANMYSLFESKSAALNDFILDRIEDRDHRFIEPTVTRKLNISDSVELDICEILWSEADQEFLARIGILDLSESAYNLFVSVKKKITAAGANRSKLLSHLIDGAKE